MDCPSIAQGQRARQAPDSGARVHSVASNGRLVDFRRVVRRGDADGRAHDAGARTSARERGTRPRFPASIALRSACRRAHPLAVKQELVEVDAYLAREAVGDEWPGKGYASTGGSGWTEHAKLVQPGASWDGSCSSSPRGSSSSLLGLTYAAALPRRWLPAAQLAILLVPAGAATWLRVSQRFRTCWEVAFAHFLAAGAVVLASLAGDWAVLVSGRSLKTPVGFASLKLGEDLAIIAAIVIADGVMEGLLFRMKTSLLIRRLRVDARGQVDGLERATTLVAEPQCRRRWGGAGRKEALSLPGGRMAPGKQSRRVRVRPPRTAEA